jgi:hypothetical protein
MSSRTCAKPSCSVTASATLTYDYSGQSVWIELLNPEAHPMRYDLCTEHADALRVPNGWELKDLRAAVSHAIAS